MKKASFVLALIAVFVTAFFVLGWLDWQLAKKELVETSEAYLRFMNDESEPS